jgi:endonuclease G
MRRLYSPVAFCVLVFASAFSDFALAQTCADLFYKGTAPVLNSKKLEPRTHQLCFSQISLLYSGIARTPLWSAEHLTRNGLEQAHRLGRLRSNAFHEEDQLPYDERAELADYRRSGFDRGHMSPNGDMSTPEAQMESFSLANMVPQHPCNNEVIWEGIESAVRSLVSEVGEVYVVTGPAFFGDTLQSLNGRVLIPTHIYKAIYVPSRKAAGVYLSPNDASQKWQPLSVAELQTMIGIDVFPALPKEIKDHAMELPQPTPHYGCRLRVTDVAANGAGGN